SDDGVTTSFQQSRKSRPPMLDHQDKYMMKAQFISLSKILLHLHLIFFLGFPMIMDEMNVIIDVEYGDLRFMLMADGTLYGRHGLRAQHILDALRGEGSATAIDLLNTITSVVNLRLTRRCLPILAEFVASAPLTPLLKQDNEVWPIAVGTIWRRFVSKVAMKGVSKEMLKYLGDF
nr:putative reverse transcriptase domain-containing protein [Tanacetum cinerariifolium]